MNQLSLLAPLLIAAGLTALITPWVRNVALRQGAVDHPGDSRRIHTAPQPRWGGIALFLGFAASALLTLPGLSSSRPFQALLLGGFVIMLVGAWDDLHELSAWHKLVWQLVVGALVVAFGVGIDFITNPFGGVIHFDDALPLLSDLVTIFWIVAVVNTVNFLDGLDGLATGIGAIAALVVAALSLSPAVDQPQTAALALALAGAALGFLPYNFNPARIFLGDSGSMFLGYALAVLAIISGGKVATAVIVLGFPLLDLIWAVIRRSARGVSPFRADRYHLHHRLLEIGLSQRRAVLLLYALSLGYGAMAVFASSRQKLYLLASLTAAMVAILLFALLVVRSRLRRSGGN
jgi:UDP-GlcNAc:undecaprenyl-phosphate/decaprenyl-phosphate GlcNAc-1-phosphate transferase